MYSWRVYKEGRWRAVTNAIVTPHDWRPLGCSSRPSLTRRVDSLEFGGFWFTRGRISILSQVNSALFIFGLFLFFIFYFYVSILHELSWGEWVIRQCNLRMLWFWIDRFCLNSCLLCLVLLFLHKVSVWLYCVLVSFCVEFIWKQLCMYQIWCCY